MRVTGSQDFRPITQMRSRSAKLVQQVRMTKNPVIITQRGRPSAVLEDLETWETRLERVEMLEQVIRGIQDIQNGDTIPHKVLMKRLNRKLDA